MAVVGVEESAVNLEYPGGPSLQFGYDIVSIVAEQGYCVIQMPESSDDERKELVRDAQLLPRQYRMKQEIEVGYMGFDCSTKIAIRKHDTPKVQVTDTMTRVDRCLTNIALSLNGIPQQDLGFKCKSRTNAFVRTSYKDAFEESILSPESLKEMEETDDWSTDVTSFLTFVQARTLSMLYMVENSGGDIWLYPKDANNTYGVRVPVVPNTLLIFRHDLADYSYQPLGESVALQAWIMKDRSDMKAIKKIDLNMEQREAVVNPGQPVPTGQPVYVRNLHVRFPNVEGKGQYWQFFCGGTDGVTQWPHARWPTEPYYMEGDLAASHGKAYTCHGGFTNDSQVMSFDNKFFGLSDEEGDSMVITQRWVCEVGYQCLVGAGWTKETLRGAPIGTWGGDVGPDWHTFSTEWARFHPNDTQTMARLNVHSHITAGRLHYLYGMTGPVSSYDTACSASLVAMNAGHTFMCADEKAVQGDDHSMALVFGVNTLLGPGSFIGNCAAGMLSHVGRCFTFNKAADGYQRGEGCGAMFLTPYGGDDSMATIIGTATNQDGRSATITAPHGPSQTEVIKKSMNFGGINVNLVTMAECHGTGTALGDPIEVGALQAVMKKREIPMLKVSTKTHIGHLEAGAGIAGVTKCVLMIRASCGPPNCHFNAVNPNIELSGYPVHIDTEMMDTGYSSGYCGVSSFGFGGTNSRADVYSEATMGPRKAIHIPMPLPSYPRYMFDAESDDVSFIGSSTAWASSEAMELNDDGTRTYLLTLGHTRMESFRLMLGTDSAREFYPGVHKGDVTAQCLGPDDLAQGRYWVIDGREDGMPVGTIYQITLQAIGGHKRVWWEPIGISQEPIKDTYDHQYYCIGSFNRWNMQPMTAVAGEKDTLEITFQIGPFLVEEFQLVRDKDPHQTFFPGAGMAVCGPDKMGHGNLDQKFSVRGRQFDFISVRLSVEDGIYTVKAVSPSTGPQTWGGSSAFALTDQQSYQVVFSDGQLMPMILTEGVFKATVAIGFTGHEDFQILLNEDIEKRIAPSQKGALLPPRADAMTTWAIDGEPGSEWDIVLDLTAGSVISHPKGLPALT